VDGREGDELIYPIGNENVGILGAFVVAIGAENNFLPVG
jgi:hypothetical protein